MILHNDRSISGYVLVNPMLRPLLAAAFVLVCNSALADDPVTPSGCENLDDIPVVYDIDYNSAVQGMFNNFDGIGSTCNSCHFSLDDGTPNGDLDLTAGVSWSHLVDQNSSQTLSPLLRVMPNAPEMSLLFQKLNCTTPSIGVRMPYGGPYLTREQQALIYDWIAGGAPSGSTSTIFRNGLEVRK